MAQLTSLRLAGWKSIRNAKIEFRPLNVLIGANGAGKSNLVSFFKLLNEMRERRLQVHIGTIGGAEALLHYGSKLTPAIEADLQFVTDQYPCQYSLRLVPAAGNTLLFDAEQLMDHHNVPPRFGDVRIKTGHQESDLDLSQYLARCQVFHFHDTSLLGPMRRDCPVDANRSLYADAANLPAMLHLYRERYPTAYRRIVAAVKSVAPCFQDFVLEPLRLNPRNIALHWRAKDSDYDFGPHQLSDGTLRAIALFTLLLQPEEDLPALIVLDEPELGLHPSAIEVVAGMIRAVSHHCQVVLATQSATLLDHFDPEEIIVTDLDKGSSRFRRLSAKELAHWQKDYTIGQLWQKNVIGGGPLP